MLRIPDGDPEANEPDGNFADVGDRLAISEYFTQNSFHALLSKLFIIWWWLGPVWCTSKTYTKRCRGLSPARPWKNSTSVKDTRESLENNFGLMVSHGSMIWKKEAPTQETDHQNHQRHSLKNWKDWKRFKRICWKMKRKRRSLDRISLMQGLLEVSTSWLQRLFHLISREIHKTSQSSWKRSLKKNDWNNWIRFSLININRNRSVSFYTRFHQSIPFLFVPLDEPGHHLMCYSFDIVRQFWMLF